jgi:hypothetical protein
MRVVAVRKSRVSSVLLGDTKMYGKKNMFDGSDESCWNSDKARMHAHTHARVGWRAAHAACALLTRRACVCVCVQGVPQWVEMEFDGGECVVDRLEAMFQGGFVGTVRRCMHVHVHVRSLG